MQEQQRVELKGLRQTSRKMTQRTSLLILIVVLTVCECVRFGPICRGNPTNTRRSTDSWGSGAYGAGRQDRRHAGLDIVCNDGSEVIAPFDVNVRGKLVVYNDPTGAKAAINEGINLEGEGLVFKLFYVRADQEYVTVRKGQRIGFMLPMQSVYPGITSHVHVQLRDKSDPSQYF